GEGGAATPELAVGDVSDVVEESLRGGAVKSSISWRRWRTSATAAVLVIGLIGVGYVASTASAKSHAGITLRVSLFGDFGYHDLSKQFEASHPKVELN